MPHTTTKQTTRYYSDFYPGENIERSSGEEGGRGGGNTLEYPGIGIMNVKNEIKD